MDLFLKISIGIFLGMLGGRIANYLKLPSVSGYIIAGLVLGPSFIHLMSSQELSALSFITDIALAFIAFSIGNEFLIADMKKVGKNALILTIGEVTGAIGLVFLTMFFIFKQNFAFSMVTATLSASTAPAGIVMVIRELRAKGPLVKNILPVVAFDDALGIMLFSVALSVAKMTSGVEDFTLLQIISAPLVEIIGSLVLGLVLGIGMSYFSRKVKGKDDLLILTTAFILLGLGAANFFDLSALLVAMVMGGTLVNTMQNSQRVFRSINDFTPPINLLFFALAGMGLDLHVLSSVGLMGIGYIFARGLGKVIGAAISAKALGSSKNIQKYLGMSLLTQGGISIGLSTIVSNELPQFSDTIVPLILFGVLIFEIMGPILAKIAITRAGEVGGMDRDDA